MDLKTPAYDLNDELQEFSVVFTDRSLNSMSKTFQQVMRDLHEGLTDVYGAKSAVIVPGGGTYAMEAVARQFGQNADVLIVRNGWFSYRWSQIFDACGMAKSEVVLKAAPVSDEPQAAFQPMAIDTVTAEIMAKKPQVVFAPHVETSAGMILPDDYIKALTDAAHAVGALFVLDCIASGAMWVDMKALGVDVLVSAPQKGWSSTPSSGLVMLSEAGEAKMADTKANSFAVDLGKWHAIMGAYLGGGHAYHATMPTDSLRQFRDSLVETRAYGFDKLKQAQIDLGKGIRDVLSQRGFKFVAAPGFEAPGVVVVHTDEDRLHKGAAFAAEGMQIAAGVPLAIDEPASYKTFRLGLFGLDKLYDVPGTIGRFAEVFDKVVPEA